MARRENRNSQAGLKKRLEALLKQPENQVEHPCATRSHRLPPTCGRTQTTGVPMREKKTREFCVVAAAVRRHGWRTTADPTGRDGGLRGAVCGG